MLTESSRPFPSRPSLSPPRRTVAPSPKTVAPVLGAVPTTDHPQDVAPHHSPAGITDVSEPWRTISPPPSPLLQTAGKLARQTSTAAHVCTTTTGRLFVTDKYSKQRFLIDTSSDFCVFPRKLVPRRRSRVNYGLRAANGTTIHTYGWLPFRLNLALRRDFTWHFKLADVTQPLIGADFLSHFGLLVDCRRKRLLDGVTSLTTPAKTASPMIPSVKVISTGT
jgi:hypothetical protein